MPPALMEHLSRSRAKRGNSRICLTSSLLSCKLKFHLFKNYLGIWGTLNVPIFPHTSRYVCNQVQTCPVSSLHSFNQHRWVLCPSAAHWNCTYFTRSQMTPNSQTLWALKFIDIFDHSKIYVFWNTSSFLKSSLQVTYMTPHFLSFSLLLISDYALLVFFSPSNSSMLMLPGVSSLALSLTCTGFPRKIHPCASFHYSFPTHESITGPPNPHQQEMDQESFVPPRRTYSKEATVERRVKMNSPKDPVRSHR